MALLYSLSCCYVGCDFSAVWNVPEPDALTDEEETEAGEMAAEITLAHILTDHKGQEVLVTLQRWVDGVEEPLLDGSSGVWMKEGAERIGTPESDSKIENDRS